jgi:DNA-binding transcriptional MocR family regulator
MAALPIELDRARKTPLAAQIYSAIREAIETGQLAPGARLPSWRLLVMEAAGANAGMTGARLIEKFRQLMPRSCEGCRMSACGPEADIGSFYHRQADKGQLEERSADRDGDAHSRYLFKRHVFSNQYPTAEGSLRLLSGSPARLPH